MLAAGCGDDDNGPLEPLELVADPAVQTGCLPDPPGAGQTRAKLVDCLDERPDGRLASGRIGDIVLANSKIQVVIRGFGEGYFFPGTKAGGIVDAARIGGEDILKEIQPILELNAGAFDEFVITEAGDDGPAEVVVRGPAIVMPFIDAAISTQPIDAILELHYILEPDSDTLLMRMTAFGADGAGIVVQHGEGLFFGGRVAIFVPNRGFIEGAGSSGEFIASAGSATTSYGIAYAAEAAQSVQFVDIGGVVLSVGPTTSLAEPEPLDRYFIVGDGSVSSVTDRAWQLRGVETGVIRGTTDPNVAIAVESGGTAVTRGRSNSDGTFRIAVPTGSYILRAESLDRDAPDRDNGPDATATVTAGQETTADLDAGAFGTVSVTVADDGGAPLPTRVVATAAGFRRIDWTDASGAVQFNLPPGDYTLNISRGMEYDAYTMTPMTVTAGGTVEVDAILNRVLDTDGWISIDTHLHSEMSSDSSFPLDLRLKGVAGEGVEVAISTDHDFITDYAPVIDEVGLAGWLTSRVGEEISSIVWGHINAWPFAADYDQPAGGAVHWYHVSPGEVMARAHAGNPDRIVQINHPRSGSAAGLFDALNLDPVTLTANIDPEDLGLPSDTDLNDFSFDAIEVGNDLDDDGFEATLIDWLGLVASGHPSAATGSSDSHSAGAYSGNSRTYVYVGAGNDDPATVDLAMVDANLKARRALVAQGSFVVAGLEIPGGAEVSLPGDLVDLSGQAEARIYIKVQAPPWQPLKQIRIYAGTDVVRTIPLDSGETAAVRYEGTVNLSIGGEDTFFVVRVDPDGDGAPVLGGTVGSLTNPLMVDADGDGQWTP
jgi:hypothetical protein